jgi:imidazolonepropionase-like amidohydrolase
VVCHIQKGAPKSVPTSPTVTCTGPQGLGLWSKTRVVLFEAGVASANGLSVREALATITIDAARILGVADRIGSIEPGKDADLALFDGDPFEYTTHCTGVIIDGVVVADQPR